MGLWLGFMLLRDGIDRVFPADILLACFRYIGIGYHALLGFLAAEMPYLLCTNYVANGDIMEGLSHHLS
jgi:hypothetical protein